MYSTPVVVKKTPRGLEIATAVPIPFVDVPVPEPVSVEVIPGEKIKGTIV